MNTTECRVKLAWDLADERAKLLAYASIVIDASLVIRDIRIVSGSGGPFISMPSRRIADRCPECGSKNHLQASFCSRCGLELDPHRATRGNGSHAQLHADVAHPINESCRRLIHDVVLAEYRREREAAKATR